MIACDSCGRHHFETEQRCPFCKTTPNPAIWVMNLLGGVVTTVVLAACYGTGGFYDKYYTPTGDTFGPTDTTPTDRTDRTDRTEPTGETGETTGDTGSPSTGDTGSPSTGDTGSPSTGDTGGPEETGTPTGDTGTPTGETGENTGDTGLTQFIDNDGDGYPLPWDCNDNSVTINPDYPEQCADAIDNDCDGLIDGADPQCP